MVRTTKCLAVYIVLSSCAQYGEEFFKPVSFQMANLCHCWSESWYEPDLNFTDSFKIHSHVSQLSQEEETVSLNCPPTSKCSCHVVSNLRDI
jgi:hypothetical protein